jgi:hypothetical protein
MLSGCRAAAEQRDELASFQLIELHSVPCAARAGLQDIELARISQRVSRAFCNRSTGPMTGWGHERPKGDVRIESVRLPTADIGWRGP